jgi:hypothetical protein
MSMKNFVIAGTLGMAVVFSGSAFAQSGGVTIPGLGSGKGSVGSDVTNSRISVTNNKSSDVTAGGGKVGAIGLGEVSLDGAANVNSVNITGSRVKNSDITVNGNESTGVRAIGGVANVNSVNIN